ncbi:MAG TPA: type II secretion system protein [Sedimentisphaerales bacterium]|nr:type II secretion system protein [Sedimentisphaerales bacterium]
MGSCTDKTGVTLIEMLIVVAVIALMVSMVVGIGQRTHTQGQIQLTGESIAIVVTALQQFQEHGYAYKATAYAELDFPLDCNGFASDALLRTLERGLGWDAGAANIAPLNPGDPIEHKAEFSGSEALYFFLSRVPECRKTLERMDRSLLTNRDDKGYGMQLRTPPPAGDFALWRIIDPWGTTLDYDYYDETKPEAEFAGTKRSFPVVTSAGPDRQFGTPDDLTSR